MTNAQRVVMCTALALAIYSPTAGGQGQFEVASVRVNRSGEASYRVRTPLGERFTATNVTLKTLILDAFAIRTFQLSGAPGWIDSERFDIDAKLHTSDASAKTLSPEELEPLVRQLLMSRFGLRVHRVTKELPVFFLRAAKGGPQLQQDSGANSRETDWGKDHINARSVTMTEFGSVLERLLDRAVVDTTKISGLFDFHLTWTPDMLQAADTSGPSIFTALREQYGLELKAGKGPVEAVVIEAIERPPEQWE